MIHTLWIVGQIGTKKHSREGQGEEVAVAGATRSVLKALAPCALNRLCSGEHGQSGEGEVRPSALANPSGFCPVQGEEGLHSHHNQVLPHAIISPPSFILLLHLMPHFDSHILDPR